MSKKYGHRQSSEPILMLFEVFSVNSVSSVAKPFKAYWIWQTQK